MNDYDRLPRALRLWLAEARLPWSPSSARRAWRKAMVKALGREAKALALMDALEDARLAQDALVQQRAAEGLLPPCKHGQTEVEGPRKR